MLYIKVERKSGEEARRRLLELNMLDMKHRIRTEGDSIVIPLIEGANRAKAAFSLAGIPNKEFIELDFKDKNPVKLRPRSLHEALGDILSESELKLLPKAFDLVGDIAVLDVPEELKPREKEIGMRLLETFRSIKVVACKTSPVGSEYRIRDLRVVAGEKRTTTVHREQGCVYRLDLKEAYFTPRLSQERMRVALQVDTRERVLVMFAGVGPYPILIAKKAKPREKIQAVELNPKAVEYMRENILLNKVQDYVLEVEGDARVETSKLGKFDRIVMPLPKDAAHFLDVALHALNRGGVVHFYDFAHDGRESSDRVVKIVGELGCKVEILAVVRCGTYSPCLSRYCVDFRVV